MPRRLATADQIRQMVQNRVDAIEEVREDQAEVRVPLPTRHDPDAEGCNWDMGVFGNTRGYGELLRAAVEAVRYQFNLEE